VSEFSAPPPLVMVRIAPRVDRVSVVASELTPEIATLFVELPPSSYVNPPDAGVYVAAPSRIESGPAFELARFSALCRMGTFPFAQPLAGGTHHSFALAPPAVARTTTNAISGTSARRMA
jgi:hypothetical protein